MPVTYENGEARAKPGSSKQCQAEKLANEMKKIGQALKQRGIETALTSPKLALEFSSYAPKLHAPKLKLNLGGRNVNGTKKQVPAPPVEAPEAPPKNLVEKLDRFLLPDLESCLLNIPEPRPWFGPGSSTPEAGTLSSRLTAAEPGPLWGTQDGAAAGEEPASGMPGAAGAEERLRRPPHLTLIFPLNLSQFVPPEGMGPSGPGRDDRQGSDGEALVDAAATAAAQHQHQHQHQHQPAAAAANGGQADHQHTQRQQQVPPAAEAAGRESEVQQPPDQALADPMPSPSTRRKHVKIMTQQQGGGNQGAEE